MTQTATAPITESDGVKLGLSREAVAEVAQAFRVVCDFFDLHLSCFASDEDAVETVEAVLREALPYIRAMISDEIEAASDAYEARVIPGFEDSNQVMSALIAYAYAADVARYGR